MKEHKSMKKACLAGLLIGQLLMKQVEDRYGASRASHSGVQFLEARTLTLHGVQSQLVTPGNRFANLKLQCQLWLSQPT